MTKWSWTLYHLCVCMHLRACMYMHIWAYIHVCICVYTCMSVHVYVCVPCVWGRLEVDVNVFLYHSPPYLRWSLSLNLGMSGSLDWLPGSPEISLSLPHSSKVTGPRQLFTWILGGKHFAQEPFLSLHPCLKTVVQPTGEERRRVTSQILFLRGKGDGRELSIRL